MEFDGHSNTKGVLVLAYTSAGTALVGAVIDTLGFESCEFFILTGTIGAGTSVAVLEQSPDDGSGSPTGVWTAVPAAEILGALPSIIATDDDTVFRVGSIGKERHQRLSLPETTTWTTFSVSAIAVLSNPVSKPVADQST